MGERIGGAGTNLGGVQVGSAVPPGGAQAMSPPRPPLAGAGPSGQLGTARPQFVGANVGSPGMPHRVMPWQGAGGASAQTGAGSPLIVNGQSPRSPLPGPGGRVVAPYYVGGSPVFR